ncbi:MAG: single-stranded DNA-binding protein [Pseudonocardiales bacterium]|nr:MAG: single-stranded DNA-binding protein [Pseudonocardiales bacterium]
MTAPTSRVRSQPPDEVVPYRNEVVLVGRLAAAVVERPLPSGDLLATWRLIVARPPATRTVAHGTAGVDTIDCRAWSSRVRRQSQRWEPGDVIELYGALRRRFWRSATGPASRYEVDVVTAHKFRADSRNRSGGSRRVSAAGGSPAPLRAWV